MPPGYLPVYMPNYLLVLKNEKVKEPEREPPVLS
jgi:hypothetical protein